MRSLKIAHVLTHLSASGEYGGPVRVAADLARAHTSLGHACVLLGGGRPSDVGLTNLDGVSTAVYRSFRLPAGGYATWFSPQLTRAVHVAASRHFDVTHVHLARDFSTLPVALGLALSGAPYVVQTHGMIDASKRFSAKVIDLAMTSRALRGASAVITLTPQETAEVIRLGADAGKVRQIRNGIDLTGFAGPDDRDPDSKRLGPVTFLARLHPRKGLRVFLEAARIYADQDPSATFVVAGPDEGDLPLIDKLASDLLSTGRLRYDGALTKTQVASAMADASLYVLPAPDEPFGLTIVEALARATPVALHHSAVLAPGIASAGAGETFVGGAEDLAQAFARGLDATKYASRCGKALKYAEKFEVMSVALEHVDLYQQAVARHVAG